MRVMRNYGEESSAERADYVVSRKDSWNLDTFLLTALTNGLATLADELHGWPQNETFPEFEDWQKALRAASDDAYWCLITYDEIANNIFVEYYGDIREKFGRDIVGSLNHQLEADKKEEYLSKNKDLDNELKMRKDRLLDFVKEWFFALWD